MTDPGYTADNPVNVRGIKDLYVSTGSGSVYRIEINNLYGRAAKNEPCPVHAVEPPISDLPNGTVVIPTTNQNDCTDNYVKVGGKWWAHGIGEIVFHADDHLFYRWPNARVYDALRGVYMNRREAADAARHNREDYA